MSTTTKNTAIATQDQFGSVLDAAGAVEQWHLIIDTRSAAPRVTVEKQHILFAKLAPHNLLAVYAPVLGQWTEKHRNRLERGEYHKCEDIGVAVETYINEPETRKALRFELYGLLDPASTYCANVMIFETLAFPMDEMSELHPDGPADQEFEGEDALDIFKEQSRQTIHFSPLLRVDLPSGEGKDDLFANRYNERGRRLAPEGWVLILRQDDVGPVVDVRRICVHDEADLAVLRDPGSISIMLGSGWLAVEDIAEAMKPGGALRDDLERLITGLTVAATGRARERIERQATEALIRMREHLAETNYVDEQPTSVDRMTLTQMGYRYGALISDLGAVQ